MGMSDDWAMRRTCAECPWLLSSPVGKFSIDRFLELADTCKPGGLPGHVFACHMSPTGQPRACAGMVIALRDNLPNRVRMLVAQGFMDPDDVTATGLLYPTYRAMAAANYCDPDEPEFEGLPGG